MVNNKLTKRPIKTASPVPYKNVVPPKQHNIEEHNILSEDCITVSYPFLMKIQSVVGDYSIVLEADCFSPVSEIITIFSTSKLKLTFILISLEKLWSIFKVSELVPFLTSLLEETIDYFQVNNVNLTFKKLKQYLSEKGLNIQNLIGKTFEEIDKEITEIDPSKKVLYWAKQDLSSLNNLAEKFGTNKKLTLKTQLLDSFPFEPMPFPGEIFCILNKKHPTIEKYIRNMKLIQREVKKTISEPTFSYSEGPLTQDQLFSLLNSATIVEKLQTTENLCKDLFTLSQIKDEEEFTLSLKKLLLSNNEFGIFLDNCLQIVNNFE
eukprot:snap_masked-scaffold_16-processed-gene-4.23-mRNA-1 protein AED:1.00 eAED:1.00 QI:0/0/0/0/1/1/2/0/320